ncbi:MAG: hypothetical protein ACK46T_41650, partial [Bradyrhizobium sp.]
CSGVGITIDLAAIPKPGGVELERWLQTFPSFGHLIAAPPAHVPDILARFRCRDIAAAVIGDVVERPVVSITDGGASEVIWDFAQRALLGCSRPAMAGASG